MSLILEALRKSEAERRLGSAPGVLAPMPVLHAPTPRSRAPLAVAGLIALAALVAFGWLWLHREQATALPSMATHSIRPASGASAHGNPAHAPANPPEPVDASHAPRTMPIITLPVTAAPQADTPESPARADTIATRAATAALNPAQASTTANPAKKPEAPAMPIVATPTAVISTAVSTPPAIPQASEPALLPLSDLPADERGGLPALKVSMHVYADDPAQRFMIVNGQRVGEGAQLGDGIVIVRIRRDGAEIDLRGRRLLLPKP